MTLNSFFQSTDPTRFLNVIELLSKFLSKFLVKKSNTFRIDIKLNRIKELANKPSAHKMDQTQSLHVTRVSSLCLLGNTAIHHVRIGLPSAKNIFETVRKMSLWARIISIADSVLLQKKNFLQSFCVCVSVKKS